MTAAPSTAGTASIPASPRAALLAHLAGDMRAALEAGDIEAARIANETIARLLGAGGVELAQVIDFEAERARRER